jgi:hypothetical protein
MRKKFIPSVAGKNTIKLFDAETGQLYRQFNTGGTISGQPIVTESEIYVEITESGNNKVIKYYSLPNCGLKKTVRI